MENNQEQERIENFIVVVCPKQKLVKIFERGSKKRKNKLLKTYRFKEDIPKVEKTIQVEHYDWGEWSVADRGWTEEKTVMVYDENIKQSIAERTLSIYTTYIKQ